MESRQSMTTMDRKISEEFKNIIEKCICSANTLKYSYEPSLVEIEYFAEYLIQRTDLTWLNLQRIILTEETGSRLGKLLSNSQIEIILIEIRNDGQLAFIREMQKITKYYFADSRIAVLHSLAHSLNTFVTEIDFKKGTITDDGLRIFLSALKVKMTGAKSFNYKISWEGSTDLNALGLEELFECVKYQKLTVFDTLAAGDNRIRIDNSEGNSFVNVKVYGDNVDTDDMKRFLTKNKKNLKVKVEDWDVECLTLMSMIDIMKDFPMKLIVFWAPQRVSEEIARKIMDGLLKTNLHYLLVYMEDLTSDIFQMICDKLKNIKLEYLLIRGIKNMINFSPQTVVAPLEIPGLSSLCIQECSLNNRLSKEIFFKLEQSKLKSFELFKFKFNTKLANLLSNSLIGSNLTELEITYCDLKCKEVKIIAKALKHTKIAFIGLTGNEIKNDGVKAIANVLEKTKLNALNLDGNEFDECGAIELLKSVQKTKIVKCYMDNCKNISGSLDAIANFLKDNKILLKCIKKGKNTKIDEYLERNNNSLKKAKFIIDKYQKGSIPYDYEHKEHFEAYESFTDTDILWDDIDDDKERIKLNLGNKIADNYLKICGVINNKLEVNSDYSKRQVNFSHLSLEILNNIFSYLSVSDVS